MKSFMAAVCVLVVAGCSNVLMKEPFPDSTLTEQQKTELTGRWRIDDDVVSLAFTSNGIPWLAMVEWKDDRFQLNTYQLHFTKHGDALYLSMPAEPNETTNGYYFAEIKVGGQGITVWSPSVAAFEGLVKAGTLKGNVKTSGHAKEISLDTPAQEILELIATNPATIDYKNPLVFQKLD
ncbi:MAG: hypothetical protein K9M54_01960 [Kiritimatiellales bacterium]|nr:hypothetical protein [Kiritimatiellales bacterium]MCF7864401.1 hypothetical protein [Kiritimatiellales bacterium]